ncbi:MAG: CorA family divalent cation transporter, partial [Chloroflexota bacterium]
MPPTNRTPATEPATGRSGEPMTRRRPPTSPGPAGRIRVAAFRPDGMIDLDGDAALQRLPSLLTDETATVWVDLAAPSADQVQSIGATLGLHPLIVEDVLEGNQRAKLEATDDVIHVVLFALAHARQFVASEIDLVLGPRFLLSVHDDGWDPRATHHLRDGLSSIMGRGPDHLLWALCDDIVDGYFPFTDDLGDAIDEVQDQVIAEATPEALQGLFELKRELIEVRRAASPTREVFSQLTNRDLPLIDPAEIIYFRDVYDHVIRLTDELDNYRELASSTLDVYLTQVNNRLSVIMKRLTGVTVVLAGIGA